MQNRTLGTAPLENPFSTSSSAAVGSGLGGNPGRRDNIVATDYGDDDYALSFGNDEMEEQQGFSDTSPNHSSIFAVEPPSSVAAYESLSGPTQSDSTPLLPSGPVFPPFAIQHSNNPSDPLQEARGLLPVSQAESALISAADVDPIHAPDGDLNADEEATAAVNNGGVNYQTLLDNLSPSTNTGPNAEHIISITTDSPTDTADTPTNNSANNPSAALPPAAGLPPRPPPQEKPAIHPNYTPGDDIRSYHLPRTQNTSANPTYTAQSSNSYRPAQGFPHSIVAAGAPGTSSAPNGLPPPPLATFQQPPPNASQAHNSPSTQNFRQKDGSGKSEARSAVTADYDDDDVAPWPPEVQKKYDEFLRDERVFVTEGLWDRFPPGSRLFIGNLPTEKVTKRDLFHIFHKYGKLAQVSIKQAYGFVQYLEASCCHRALHNEQGMSVRGRKMHLEISKPQKNSRNAAATAAGDSLRAGYSRRSRSPDYGRVPPPRGSAQRMGGDRVDRGVPFSDFRDEPRRRDDYRPVRSPSPRGYRGRDEYRGGRDRSLDRYVGGRRSRSRSPYNRGGRYRSRSPPRGRDIDDDAALPMPRRDPRDVPDVQLILVDDLDRNFVAYIEKSFRDRGLRCDFLLLPRVPLAAVVRRQILEGVRAVVKMGRNAQATGKIPLQVFDRSGGENNVRFEEYDNLEAHIAAELVIRARSTQTAPQPPAGQYATAAPPYAAPQYGQVPQTPVQQQPPQAAAPPPNLANLITSLDGPALQKLLGAMAQNPQTPQQQTAQHAPHQHQQPLAPTAGTPDLAALLGGIPRQQAPSHQAYQQAQQAQQQHNSYSALSSGPGFAGNPGLAALLGGGGNRAPSGALPPQQQGPQANQQHVQSIMEQLAKWKQ
ncbi:RNA recognition motif domain [Lasallia pustulata]|uniref:RNA recognition motif domain n=1 Tax=Lasallia pustulata TaxID=136370 RepID=A0A1W5DDD9_9LECA|nr:RNA recognition motif domain [Lasallia pustulata]